MGSVTVRIIGRRVDFTVRINPLMLTPPLQEGLPSGGRRASTNQMRVFLDWLQKCENILTFKRHLKTHLFKLT